ncbi:ENTS family enterobactin (siderophore) exporter [Saccharothrix tamanrassetensis]|uniref:ENTS family enterobactin (Siderophore) exporter n=1 Tax=Saccharothrix tamanrassetensis TaxID=1051531 RepID=A0A841C9N4_9PSEU|nr:MFS transporter [Saccharothrix tamanrassetensis]MBB5953670.1 ENTS family enterobactin (siderophore) exporter [Saccharothrix tamanrassetensis]
MSKFLNRFVVDVSPLRERPDYRLIFTGYLISVLGSQMATVAIAYQVYVTTGSSWMVGLLSVVELVPQVFGMLLGGVVADRMDRRRLLLVLQCASVLTSGGLAIVALGATTPLTAVFVLVAVRALLGGLAAPAYTAASARAAGPRLLPAAAALNAIVIQAGVFIGPAIGGVLIGRTGLPWVYLLDMATFGAFAVLLLLTKPAPPERAEAEDHGAGLAGIGRSLLRGLKFTKDQPILRGVMLIDLNAMVFGMPRALFPAFGMAVFAAGPESVGLLYAAPAAGALVAALASGWVGRVRKLGHLTLYAVAAWGAAIAVFGLVTSFPVALVVLAVAGAADVVSEMCRSTLVQRSVPDRLRGRVSGLWLAQTNAAPRLGDARAGAVAGLASPALAALSGGLLCIVGVVLCAWLLPELRKAVNTEEDPSPRAAEPAPHE